MACLKQVTPYPKLPHFEHMALDQFIQLDGELFEKVQLNQVFADSKTFVDCFPRYLPYQVLAEYQAQRLEPEFNLSEFVTRFFVVPGGIAQELNLRPGRSMEEHIAALWGILTRQADPDHNPYSSLIPLPEPFVAPGGRFSEIYYWDTYFTSQGLIVGGHLDLVNQLVKNFAYLIKRCGFVPNGNRLYYLTRSQPPFFCSLVHILSRYIGFTAVLDYLPLIEDEYNFWMRGARAVELAPGITLNRYWDSLTTPRPESYKEDIELARQASDKASFYRNIRAACESGWDFSSRWFEDSQNLATINTTDLLPVDLNTILFSIEEQLATWYYEAQLLDKAQFYRNRAQLRQQHITDYLWDDQLGFFFDYNVHTGAPTSTWSLAAVYPLYFRLATPKQAQQVASHIQEKFLHPGGLVTTLNFSQHQWDSPNGWAPLQWLAIIGLRNYGFDELAFQIASVFVQNVRTIFNATQRMMEKYNVMDLSLAASGGEYPLQDGFGWTNGVVAALLGLYPELAEVKA
jgi:alpha,alpha-trehalase